MHNISDVIIMLHGFVQYFIQVLLLHVTNLLWFGVRQSNDIDMDRHYSNSVNIQSLEAVFLKLVYELSKRRDKDVEDIPDEKKASLP